MSVVDRLEESRFWLIGRLLIPSRVRARACVARGHHNPQFVDLGYAKSCSGCGTVNR